MIEQEKREKVIRALYGCSNVQSGFTDAIYVCPTCIYGREDGTPCESLHRLLYDAHELIKSQEAVEPYGQYSVHTGTKYIVCGACEKPLCMMKDSYRPKYCHECGRMVKWHANEAEK